MSAILFVPAQFCRSCQSFHCFALNSTVLHSISLFLHWWNCSQSANQNAEIAACILLGQKSYLWFQNRTSAQRDFDLKSQVWFQTKIARPEVQLPLYCIHFEIAQFNSLNTRTTRTIKVVKFAKQWPFCLSFSCKVIG